MNYDLTDILELFGSLGLFLFGMKVMSDALMDLAGDRMRSILARLTSNRFLGVFTGFLITAVIQSSSATTLMVVSFANATLLSLTESISVIMGANIGTTVTAWLITILGFKVSMSTIALPLVGVGFAFNFSKKEQARKWGYFIIGFALLFIGLQFLKEAMPNINENPGMLEFVTRFTDMGFGSILIFLLIGTLLTVIIQSSSATMAVTLIMTAQGWIPFELAAAMILGENIGTTITANLAAIVGNYHARRTARAHLLFNVIGVVWVLLLFYPFLKMIAGIVVKLEGESPFLSVAVIPVAISLFHTIFNVANTFVLIWFIDPIARLVERMVPEEVEPEKAIEEPKYLNKSVLKYPETLIAALLEESKYLFDNAVFEILAHGLSIHRADVESKVKLKKVIADSRTDMKIDVRELYFTKIKSIYGQIISYAARGQSTLKLNERQNKMILEIRLANRRMVQIVRDLKEISTNVSMYLESDNVHMKQQYDVFRKRIAKVLRTLHRFREEEPEAKQRYYNRLMALKAEAKAGMHQSHEDINALIRDKLVTIEMASSLVNDFDNVNDIIKKLIDVGDLLYAEHDPLFENGQLPQTDVAA